MTKEEINVLCEELVAAANSYYQLGEKGLTMTDAEYDEKLATVRENVTDEEIANNEMLWNLFNSPSAGTIPTENVVKHASPMLSLAKAKNKDELYKYFSRLSIAGATGFSLQAKLDGLALSVIYKNGNIVRIVTRGNGEQGEDITHLLKCSDVTVIGLPQKLPNKNNVEVRGELFIRNSDFIAINKAREEACGETFSNSRNAVAGITKRSAGVLGYHATLTFCKYSSHDIHGNPITLDNIEGLLDIQDLTRMEIKNTSETDVKIMNNVVDYDILMDSIEVFGRLRATFDVPTDGVVVKPYNEIEMLEKLGNTSHHPVANIAYKYAGTTGEGTVREIVLTVGKSGRITPKAVITPVKIDGVSIENVSCHNFNWLYDMGVRVGSTVVITRANDVIPAILSVSNIGNGELLAIPTVCPECGGELSSDGLVPPKTLECVNSNCPSRVLFYMKTLVSRPYLDIDGLSEVGLNYLCEIGRLKVVSDLFTLTVDELSSVKTGRQKQNGDEILLGPVRATKIYNSIQNAKQNTSSVNILASLGFKNLGRGGSKLLINHFGTIENVLLLTKTAEDLLKIDGFSDITVNNFLNHYEVAKKELERLMKIGVKMNNPTNNKAEKGYTFAVTGSVQGFDNRDSLVKYMEKQGWEFHSTVKKDTKFLIAGFIGEPTGKIKKALDRGVIIVKSADEALNYTE